MRPYYFVFCCEALELLLWLNYKRQGEHSDYCVIQVLLCYHSIIKRKANNVPHRHRTYIRRSEDVLEVRTSSERLIYVQFTSCVYGVYSGLFITFELLIGNVLKFHCCPSCSDLSSEIHNFVTLVWWQR